MMRWLLIASVVGVVSCQVETNTEGQQKGLIDWINGWYTTTTTTTTLPPQNDPPEDCPECHCGIPRIGKRIVGGNETDVLQLPWMAALLYNKRFFCGGSLINDQYVLTAAHCTAGFRKEKMSVRFLEHDRSKANETKTIERKVIAIIRHLKYNPGTYDNDIALLKLDKRMDLSTAIKRARRDEDENEDDTDDISKIKPAPVCLAPQGHSFNDHDAMVSGWGTTEEGGSTSHTLQQVFVPIISNAACRETTYNTRITENMLCAGYTEGGKDACQGDSGGPLHVLNTTLNKYMVAGIVSWGEGCARPNTPGVYTRVNRYSTWIKSNTRDACYCQQ